MTFFGWFTPIFLVYFIIDGDFIWSIVWFPIVRSLISFVTKKKRCPDSHTQKLYVTDTGCWFLWAKQSGGGYCWHWYFQSLQSMIPHLPHPPNATSFNTNIDCSTLRKYVRKTEQINYSLNSFSNFLIPK